MNFSTLRNIQGLHAPLKLQMEYRAASQIQRLPFLPSSNLALDTLRGNDEAIGFEDILNDPAQSEMMGEPHMMVEYKLGLLWKVMDAKTAIHLEIVLLFVCLHLFTSPNPPKNKNPRPIQVAENRVKLLGWSGVQMT